MNTIIKAKSRFLNIYKEGKFSEIKEYLEFTIHKEYFEVELPDGTVINGDDFLNSYNEIIAIQL